MGGKKKATIDNDGPESSEAEKSMMKEMRAIVSYIKKLHKEHERIIARIEKITSEDFKQIGEIIETLVQQVVLVQQHAPSESRELVLTLNQTFQALAERRDPATTDNLFTTCKLPPMPKTLMAAYATTAGTSAGTSKPKSDDEEDSDDSDDSDDGDDGDDESVAAAPANKKAPAGKAPAAKAIVTTKPKSKAAEPKPKPKVAHDDLSSSDEDEAMKTVHKMPPVPARVDALVNAVATKTPKSMQPAATAQRSMVDSTKRKRKRQEADDATPVELLMDAPGVRSKAGASSSRGAPSGAPVFARGSMTFLQ